MNVTNLLWQRLATHAILSAKPIWQWFGFLYTSYLSFYDKDLHFHDECDAKGGDKKWFMLIENVTMCTSCFNLFSPPSLYTVNKDSKEEILCWFDSTQFKFHYIVVTEVNSYFRMWHLSISMFELEMEGGGGTDSVHSPSLDC